MTTTLQIADTSPEARAFLEYARTLPFVTEKSRAAIGEDITPMTTEEYHARIDRSLADIRSGRTVSQEEIDKRLAGWR